MEENSSLFSTSIDPVSKEHLTEAAKWARFLAIVGFVFLVLMIIAGVFASIAVSRFDDMYSEETSGRRMSNVLGTTTAITYIIMALIWFFPLLSLLRFANAMKAGLASNDQERINTSFQNLKVFFRYVGIVTIIGLVLMALGFFLGIAATAFSS
ncbi:MAG TPA: DUF5362 family protein [Flavisolibacter sp.]|jgi:hypothetical protein